MSKYGLQRGVVASAASHKTQQEYHREQIIKYQEDIERLLTTIKELETQKSQQELTAQDGKNRILAFFGKGELPELRRENREKDEQIAELEKRLADTKKLLADEKTTRQQDRGAYQAEIDRAIQRAETAEKKVNTYQRFSDGLLNEKRELHRKAYPERYRLSSGAELVHYWIPNRLYPSLSITTSYHGEEFRAVHYNLPTDLMHKLDTLELTPHELINILFEPWEQVHESQHHLLASVLQTATGGIPAPHVGTGSGGSSSDLPWRERKKEQARRR